MATRTRHTPWSLIDDASPEVQDVGDGFCVDVYENDAPSGDKLPAQVYGSTERIALDRARLIAAAPELLAAARMIEAALESGVLRLDASAGAIVSNNPGRRKLRAAIAKAEGGE